MKLYSPVLPDIEQDTTEEITLREFLRLDPQDRKSLSLLVRGYPTDYDEEDGY